MSTWGIRKSTLSSATGKNVFELQKFSLGPVISREVQ